MIYSKRNSPETSASPQLEERFEQEPLRFSGQLLADVQTPPLTSHTGSRSLRLALYETAEGDFVAGIIFCTSVPGEANVPMFERLDEVTSVENFFFAFEPDELLRKAGTELPSERREQIASELYRMYELANREILAVTSGRKEPRENVGNTEATEATEAN